MSSRSLERAVKVAASLFGTSGAALSLDAEGRLRLECSYGLETFENEWQSPFCEFVHRSGEVLVLPEVPENRAGETRLFPGSRGIGFYAGVPVRSQDRRQSGVLCVFDGHGRYEPAKEQVGELVEIAGLISAMLRWRREQSAVLDEIALATGELTRGGDLDPRRTGLVAVILTSVRRGLSILGSA